VFGERSEEEVWRVRWKKKVVVVVEVDG